MTLRYQGFHLSPGMCMYVGNRPFSERQRVSGCKSLRIAERIRLAHHKFFLRPRQSYWQRNSLNSKPIGTLQAAMPRPKRSLLATAQETSSPPAVLDPGHEIARVRKAEGKNLYSIALPSRTEPLLVELPSRFRSQIWIKRGGYVVVDTTAFADRDNRLDGEIVNVVRDEREWRKQSYWSVHPLG